MNTIDLIGFTAAICTTLSFLPQAIKVIKTRDTQALSLTMYSVFTFGVALWLCYGAMLGDLAIVLANAVTFCLASCILLIKVINERKPRGAKI